MIDNGAVPVAGYRPAAASRRKKRAGNAVLGGVAGFGILCCAAAAVVAVSGGPVTGTSTSGIAAPADLPAPASRMPVVAAPSFAPPSAVARVVAIRTEIARPARSTPRVDRVHAADRPHPSVHLLAFAEPASAVAFQPLAGRSQAADRFVLPPAVAVMQPPAVAVVPAPAPVLAVAMPPASSEAAPRPANAGEALLAALVPTPRSRPAHETDRLLRQANGRRAMPIAAALAYARPDAGAEANDAPLRLPPVAVQPRAGNGTAIYDISAAAVYLPNGERLEAHSGLGALRDDPRFVHTKNRGATPPHTYDLALRESRFHGVEAIRLKPVGGERRVFNRVGLLAHTYMLGKRGDSNGCVSFKDYGRFLAAFKRGEVRRLVVVPRMDGGPASRIASLFTRRG